MILKIYNVEVVDCSTSINLLVPNPESRKLLVDIFLTLCQSEAIECITDFSLSLGFGNGNEYHQTDIALHSPRAYLYGIEGFHNPANKYTLMQGKQSELNKTRGLIIEPEKVARQYPDRERYYDSKTFILPAGLRGVKQGEQIIKALLSGNNQILPSFLRNKELNYFELSAGIVWNAWSKYKEIPQVGTVQCGETDNISANSAGMEIRLGGLCVGGHGGKENGDKHYADVQRVLNQNWPEYTIQEMGESGSGGTGREALYRETKADELESIEAPDMYFGKKIVPDEKKLLIEMQKEYNFSISGYSDGVGRYSKGFCCKNEHVVEFCLNNQDINGIMKYLEKFPHLNKLIISDCNSITEFDVGKLSGLEDLNIFRCNNLTEISDTLCNSTSLKKICIENCPNFRSFPNILGKNLEKVLVSLQINRCGEFKSINFRSAKDDIKKVFEELY